ncbi:MAG: hypothetical protein KatS3mg108_3064 [Isosphaeraceae bacterium]|nr:MAG: hypothetical protein KatS3mg108_3064 [Isosphaeraceae bacterium]
MAVSQPTTTDPRINPSYPQRVHLHERPALEALLRSWDERIAAARAQLPHHPNRPAAERLLIQMEGARDQIAESVRRLPTEVGDLYAEDRHRLEEAVHALERLFDRW